MPKYVVTAIVESHRKDAVEKIVRTQFAKNGIEPYVSFVEKLEGPGSRAKRLAEASEKVSDAREIVEELASEMSDWYESIPENLQSGEKASEVDECKGLLENLSSDMDGLDFDNISFPAMM